MIGTLLDITSELIEILNDVNNVMVCLEIYIDGFVKDCDISNAITHWRYRCCALNHLSDIYLLHIIYVISCTPTVYWCWLLHSPLVGCSAVNGISVIASIWLMSHTLYLLKYTSRMPTTAVHLGLAAMYCELKWPKVIDSPLHSTSGRQNCLPLVLCKETVKQSSLQLVLCRKTV